MTQPISLKEIAHKVRDEFENISHEKMYFSLKMYGLKSIHKVTVNVARCCLALQRVGLPITTNALKLCPTIKEHTSTVLHRLGDNNVLILKRKPKRKSMLFFRYVVLEYLMHPNFLRHWEGDKG